jgi:hypothetical protein
VPAFCDRGGAAASRFGRLRGAAESAGGDSAVLPDHAEQADPFRLERGGKTRSARGSGSV